MNRPSGELDRLDNPTTFAETSWANSSQQACKKNMAWGALSTAKEAWNGSGRMEAITITTEKDNAFLQSCANFEPYPS